MASINASFLLISCLMFLSLSQVPLYQVRRIRGICPLPLICPEGTNAHGTYCYFFNEDLETWFDADVHVGAVWGQSLGVLMLNQAEGAFVVSMIKDSDTQNHNIEVGLYDPKKNHRWHWSSGFLFSYKSWVAGAPSSANPGYCASLTSNSGFLR